MRIPTTPPPGLVSDNTTFDAPGTYADGNNVRFHMGRPQIIGGWASAFSDTLTGTCRGVLPWTVNSGALNIAFGTHSDLQVYTAGALYTITPAGLTVGSIDGAGGPGYGTGGYGDGTYGESLASEWFARTWGLQAYGEYLLASPRSGTLYVWDNDTGNLATAVTNAPDAINNILVTPERQVLAFGCNEEVSGDWNPMCIRGSDTEDYTDWTTAPDNNAFEHILPGGGRIVGAELFGSYVAVWTDTSAYLGQFIGDPGQMYRFDPVAANCGLLGPNAVTVVNQVAYWMTPDLIPYRWILGGAPEPIPCPIRSDFADNMVISQGEKLSASPVGEFDEVWFHYPDERDGIENSRYIAFNTRDGTWFRGQLARTAAYDAGPAQYPLMVTAEGVAYWHENGQSANGSPLDWHIQTSSIYLGQAEKMVMIRGVWPDFEDQVGAISMTVYLKDYPQATERVKGPYVLATNVNKRDFLAQGRIASIKFSGSSAPAYMRLGKPSFDAVPTGLQ